jgi:metal-sulfur cluster biosynthetic enzyme
MVIAMSDNLDYLTKINNTSTNINSQDIVDILKTIYDPEIDFSIYDLGLIYEIIINNEKISIIMTLTSANCPEAVTLPERVNEMISSYFKEQQVSVEVVFEPLWTVDNMQDEVKLKLGLL